MLTVLTQDGVLISVIWRAKYYTLKNSALCWTALDFKSYVKFVGICLLICSFAYLCLMYFYCIYLSMYCFLPVSNQVDNKPYVTL